MKTPEYLKEIREIRRKLSKEYLKNPKEFLARASEEARKFWQKEDAKEKKGYLT